MDVIVEISCSQKETAFGLRQSQKTSLMLVETNFVIKKTSMFCRATLFL